MPWCLGQHLGEVLPVEAGVGAGRQLDHPGGDAGIEGVPGRRPRLPWARAAAPRSAYAARSRRT